MAGFVTVPDKAINDVFTETMWDTYIRDNLNKGVVRPIAEAALVAPASSIDITGIAATFSHLLLMVSARSDAALASTTLLCRLNGDTSAAYDNQELRGSAGSASAAENFGQTSAVIGGIPAASATANRFGYSHALLLNYIGTGHKTFVGLWGRSLGTGSGDLDVGAKLSHWRNVAVVNQITLLLGAGNFIAGSRATLYGMAGI